MADTFLTFGIVCLSLAAISLVATTILFFKLRIAEIAAELSGKTATEAIAKMRQEGSSRKHKGKSLQSILDKTGTEESRKELPLSIETSMTFRQSDQSVNDDSSSENPTSFLSADEESVTTILSEDIRQR
jgi:hypothetical protein